MKRSATCILWRKMQSKRGKKNVANARLRNLILIITIKYVNRLKIMKLTENYLAANYSLYRRKEWFQFRETCLNAVGRKCERCGKSHKQASLQIHHPHYGKDLLPWEYVPKFCEVLCKGCHARQHGKIKPLDGWTLVHSDWDIGEPTGLTWCEHCDALMEWHNDLWHPEWGVITVGYQCADKLGTPEVYAIKRKSERMNTFLHSPRWKQTPKGFKYKHGERMIFAMQNLNGWVLNISGTWGRINYPTINAAKERAFLFIEAKNKTQPAS